MENKFVFSVVDVADILNVSKDFAYTIFQQKDFPAMFIGKKLCVRADYFYKWIDVMETKSAQINLEEKHGRQKMYF